MRDQAKRTPRLMLITTRVAINSCMHAGSLANASATGGTESVRDTRIPIHRRPQRPGLSMPLALCTDTRAREFAAEVEERERHGAAIR